MSFVTREEASMLEAEQPEERNREVARRPPLLQSGCEAKEEMSLNSARRGCGRWRRGGLGSLRGPGRRGAGAGGGGQRISKPLRVEGVSGRVTGGRS